MSENKPGIFLPATVVERLPSLKDTRVLFFDFGLRHLHDSTSGEPVVVVLSEKSLIIASFPKATSKPLVLPLHVLSGISRDGERIALRCAALEEIELTLPKADTFVVHLIDLQDRRLNRALHLSNTEGGEDAKADTMVKKTLTKQTLDYAKKSIRDAQDVVADANELHLGVLRFGHSSVRVEKPLKEIDEGSDASSIQTVEHEIEADEIEPVDVTPVVVDRTSLYRRLWYFFLQYDRSKLRYIDDIIARHRGMENTLLVELESKYGPEPNKVRWDTRDQLAHQREINNQLKAQLARAQDELLLLGHEKTFVGQSMHRVLQRKEQLVTMMEKQLASTGTLINSESADPHNDQPLDLLVLKTESGEYYFPAPTYFFPFVVEQVSANAALQHPPLCTLTAYNSPGKRSFKDAKSVVCTKKLLAAWILKFGPHSAAIQRGGRWQFLRGDQIWGSM